MYLAVATAGGGKTAFGGNKARQNRAFMGLETTGDFAAFNLQNIDGAIKGTDKQVQIIGQYLYHINAPAMLVNGADKFTTYSIPHFHGAVIATGKKEFPVDGKRN